MNDKKNISCLYVDNLGNLRDVNSAGMRIVGVKIDLKKEIYFVFDFIRHSYSK